MENHIDDLRVDSGSLVPDSEAGGLPTWCAFALGGMVTFLFVYIGVARPATHEISLLRRELGTLDETVSRLVGHGETALEANRLLGLLSQQQQQTEAARKALQAMRDLQRQITQEAARADQAMVAVSQLATIKDGLLAHADRATQAAEVWRRTEELQYRLATAGEATREAHLASEELFALRDDLVHRGGEVDAAQNRLEQLIELRRTITAEGDGAEQARQRVSELLSLKDEIVARTVDLADAVETLELTTELSQRFREAAQSFAELRHWLVEVVAVQPLLSQARTTLEPLLEISSLRRLNAAQLRVLARAVSEAHEPQLARHEGSSTAEVSAGSPQNFMNDAFSLE